MQVRIGKKRGAGAMGSKAAAGPATKRCSSRKKSQGKGKGSSGEVSKTEKERLAKMTTLQMAERYKQAVTEAVDARCVCTRYTDIRLTVVQCCMRFPRQIMQWHCNCDVFMSSWSKEQKRCHVGGVQRQLVQPGSGSLLCCRGMWQHVGAVFFGRL